MIESTHIRVADSPPLDSLGRPIDIPEGIRRRVERKVLWRQLFFIVTMVWTLTNLSAFLYLPTVPALTGPLIYFRYLCWPLILFGLALHLRTHGIARFSEVAALFVPFFLFGVASGMLGFNLSQSLRDLVFWSLGICAATMVGAELRQDGSIRQLFYFYLFMMLASAAFAIVVPHLGVAADYRSGAHSAWNGLFANKNILGLICAYTLILALFVKRVALWLRLVAGAIAIFCLMKTNSQGSVFAAGAALAYMSAVWLLRGSGLTTPAKLFLMAGGTAITFMVLILGSDHILGFLGRDASLTGRTDIWPAFLGRAAQHWVLGTGPGTFTRPSSVTADLTARFGGFGEIATPHNMFIAAFGEVGLFGFVAFAAPLLYMVLIYPFRHDSRASLLAATIAFTMMVGGLIETREVFGLGMNMFLLMMIRSAAAAEPIGRNGPPDDDPGRLIANPIAKRS